MGWIHRCWTLIQRVDYGTWASVDIVSPCCWLGPGTNPCLDTEGWQAAPHIHSFHSPGSTNHGSKVFEEKTPQSSKVPNLNLSSTGNYLHIIYIVLGSISKMRDDLNGRIRRIYANMIAFGGGSGINPWEILTDCTSFENRYSLSSFWSFPFIWMFIFNQKFNLWAHLPSKNEIKKKRFF